MSENKTGPITDQEVDNFIAGLSETDAAELRRQQLVSRALLRAAPEKAPDLGRMSDAEFAAYKRSLGIG
jgi:hypothetical protein